MNSRLAVGLLAGAFVLGACGGGGQDRAEPVPSVATSTPDEVTSMAEFEVGHVHALALMNDELLVGTHEGLFVQSPGGAARLLGEKFDVMGMTGSDGALYTSGHPDESSKDYRDLGLRLSRDAGRTWRQVSLLGKADFHRLSVVGRVVVGINSHDGQTMRSEDGGKTWVKLGRLPIFDLAIDPSNDQRIVGTTENGVVFSSDGGKSWSPPSADPLLMLVTYTDGGLIGVTPDGAVFLRSGESWTKQGVLGGTPEAMATDGQRLVIAVKGQIVESTDLGKSFTVRLVGLPGGH